MYKDVFVTDRGFLYIPLHFFFSNNLIDYVQTDHLFTWVPLIYGIKNIIWKINVAKRKTLDIEYNA